MPTDFLQYVYDNGGVLAVFAVGAFILVYFFLNDRRKIRFKMESDRLEIQRRKDELELEKTIEVLRGEEISEERRQQEIEAEWAEMKKYLVPKSKYDALLEQFQELSKTAVDRVTFERLQADYIKLQQTAAKDQPEIIKELGIHIAYLTPLAERATRAEQAYDLLKESLADESTLHRKVVTLTLGIEAYRRKLRDAQISDDIVVPELNAPDNGTGAGSDTGANTNG